MNVEKPKMIRISSQPSPIHIMIDQKQPKNMGYFNHVGSMINYARLCVSK